MMQCKHDTRRNEEKIRKQTVVQTHLFCVRFIVSVCVGVIDAIGGEKRKQETPTFPWYKHVTCLYRTIVLSL